MHLGCRNILHLKKTHNTDCVLGLNNNDTELFPMHSWKSRFGAVR